MVPPSPCTAHISRILTLTLTLLPQSYLALILTLILTLTKRTLTQS